MWLMETEIKFLFPQAHETAQYSTLVFGSFVLRFLNSSLRYLRVQNHEVIHTSLCHAYHQDFNSSAVDDIGSVSIPL